MTLFQVDVSHGFAQLCDREKVAFGRSNMTHLARPLGNTICQSSSEKVACPGHRIEQTRDLPTEWSKQFDALRGLNPE